VTVLFARLPGTLTIWKAVSRVDPWVPVPAYLVVHFFQKIFGAGQLAIRLPSAIGFAAGLFLTFDCARRLSDGLHGLLALAFLTCSFLPYYGYEARSYGVYFCLASLALWLWAHADSGIRPAVAFGIAYFLCCSVHPYASLCLVPYGLSDVLSRRPWWRPSAKLIAGGIGVCCAIGVLSIQILAVRRASGGFPGPHPSLGALELAYSETFPGGLFLLALIAIWFALLAAGRETVSVPPMHPAERVGWLCFSIPIAGFAFAAFVTHAYASRYFVGMLPGIAVAFACLLWRYCSRIRALAAGIFLLLALAGAARQLQVVRHPESIDPYGQQTQTRQFLQLENSLWSDGKQYVLWSGNFLYLPAQYYSHHADRYVFLRPEDPRVRASMIIPLGLTPYYPFRVWTIQDLREHARETAVINPRPDTLDAMQKAGFHAEKRYAKPIDVVYFQ
jgi:hypothetical protein